MMLCNTLIIMFEFCFSFNDLSQTPLTLGPMEAVYYVWQDPLGKRELIWSCGESRNKINTLDQVNSLLREMKSSSGRECDPNIRSNYVKQVM